MNKKIESIAEDVLKGGLINKELAGDLLKESESGIDDLLYWANRIREKFFGREIVLCSIVPGRIGGCDQDCKFCAQSARYKTHIQETKLLSDDEILTAAGKAARNGVPHFGIVYSGRAVSEKELKRLERLVGQIKVKFGIGVCAGLGIIDRQQAGRLAAAGVTRYNHNLETSRNHFGKIVTTHSYEDRINTIKAAKEAGLGICAGGIFGMGETDEDRIDMALELRGLGVDTVPMNFLHPIKGTPLGESETLSPREILRIIALYRFILPKTGLKIAGGRVLNLRDLQSWVFYAGATSIMVGDYLTTAGRAVEADMQMLIDLGLEFRKGRCE